ncbi:MAG: chromosomal replication initiator protein DnaA [Candidatus Firestonebacteria bacterium]
MNDAENAIQNIWNQVLDVVKSTLDRQTFETWFLPLRTVSFTDNILIIAVPSVFFKDWITTKYKTLLEDAAKKICGNEVKFELVISSKTDEEQTIETPVHIQSEKAKPIDFLNPKHTFDNFIVGNSNRFAHAASLAVAETPATAYNPLFIYGGVGLGKTHLLHAIGKYIKEHNPNFKILYLTSEKFMNEMISSLLYGKILEFRNRFRSIDVLLIDDIQFLARKESTQEEFFHTFNALYDANKQIVASSDSHPKEINLEERLRSRFEMGLIADIQAPDLETRIAILRKKADIEKLHLPDEVTLLIANKITSNIRVLEGCLIKISAYASLTQSRITEELVHEVLKDILGFEDDKHITIDIIKKVIVDFFNLKPSDMTAKKRTKSIAFPRQIAMYLTRELTEASLPEIGQNFGGRDHTTVMHAHELIKSKRETDTNFENEMQKIIQIINSKSCV